MLNTEQKEELVESVIKAYFDEVEEGDEDPGQMAQNIVRALEKAEEA